MQKYDYEATAEEVAYDIVQDYKICGYSVKYEVDDNLDLLLYLDGNDEVDVVFSVKTIVDRLIDQANNLGTDKGLEYTHHIKRRKFTRLQDLIYK